jgi:hypothetical protein
MSEECSICLENISPSSEEGECEVKLKCNHTFHKECLKKMYRCACPLCNAEITDPDDVYASIQNNIVAKRIKELEQERTYDFLMNGLGIFLTVLIIHLYTEHISETTGAPRERKNRYPLYYRYQSNWTMTQHLSNFMIACSETYQADEAEGITWSYDLDVERTVSEYNETNDLVATSKYTINDLIAATAALDQSFVEEYADEE